MPRQAFSSQEANISRNYDATPQCRTQPNYSVSTIPQEINSDRHSWSRVPMEMPMQYSDQGYHRIDDTRQMDPSQQLSLISKLVEMAHPDMLSEIVKKLILFLPPPQVKSKKFF